jgi:hypothetical protein
VLYFAVEDFEGGKQAKKGGKKDAPVDLSLLGDLHAGVFENSI